MAARIRRILVAIRDLDRTARGALNKAASLARASGARIELFHALDLPASSGDTPSRASDPGRRLERLAHSPILAGLRVTSQVERDYPPHEAIVRRAISTRADLVIATVRHHAVGSRLLLRNTDWELIRQCPCPLLLAKSARAYETPLILAAVDPFHAHAKPANLDAALLTIGASVARTLKGSLHAFHSYMPLVNLMPVPMTPAMPVGLPPEVEDVHGAQIARAFAQLTESAGIPRAQRHLRMGAVPMQLEAVVRQLGIQLVVMGALSRSGLRRIFIGNTAERVLDSLSCDVLVVKPRGFKTTVKRRAVPAARHVVA